MPDTIIARKPSPDLLNRLLDQPGLLEMVRRLEPGALTRLIGHIGLEDAAEIVAMATAEQLARVFDEDLWHSSGPGREDTFDAQRFILWLEVMLENGADFAARKIEQFDEDLVTLALSRHLLVLDLDAMAMRAVWAAHDDEQYFVDKALEGCLCQEFDRYLVIARDHRGWDTIVAVLIELNESRYDLFSRLLERCVRYSTEFIEDNGGLHHVLTGQEMLAADMAGEREERRQRRGFVTPAAAAAFLNRARARALQQSAAATTWDPDTRLYFRALAQAESNAAPAAADEPPSTPAIADSRRLIALLQQAEVLDTPQRTSIGAGLMPGSHGRFGQAMQAIRARDEELYMRRRSEISYLGNVLMAGCPYMDRRFRPVEAAEGAIGVCQLGAEYLLDDSPTAGQTATPSKLADILAGHDAVKLFNLGWKLLHDQVSIFAADRLYHLLAQLKQRAADAQAASDLSVLMVSLKSKIKAAAVWGFLPEMDDLLEFMDNERVARFGYLLFEYPLVPPDWRGRQGLPDSPFICSRTKIVAIRQLLEEMAEA